jgi:hypothetical protein
MDETSSGKSKESLRGNVYPAADEQPALILIIILIQIRIVILIIILILIMIILILMLIIILIIIIIILINLNFLINSRSSKGRIDQGHEFFKGYVNERNLYQIG